jgi:hypothetical protein
MSADDSREKKQENVKLHKDLFNLVKDSNNQGLKQQTLQFVLDFEERLCAGCNKSLPLDHFTFEHVSGKRISPDDCYGCLVGKFPLAESVI